MKFLKLTILAIAIVTVGLIAVGESRTEARSPSEPSFLKIVTGEVSKVEGEFQMSKDRHRRRHARYRGYLLYHHRSIWERGTGRIGS